MNFIKPIFLGVAILGLTACGGGSSDDPKEGSTKLSGLASCVAVNDTQAVVCGKVLASDGVTPLVNAEITLGSNGARLARVAKGVENADKCLTDGAGEYVCLLPSDVSGEVTLKASLAGFDDSTFVAQAIAGEATQTGQQSLISNVSNKWVVVPGNYDGVQVLLSQLKGCVLSDASGNPFDSASGSPEAARGSADCESKGLLVLDTNSASANYAPDFLGSDDLSAYDLLFLNCDADYSSIIPKSVMQSFVNAGKHVYFSDLSSNWLNEAFPGKVNFAGNDTSTGVLTSVVTSPSLQAVVGSNMDIQFDLPVWTAIDSVESDVTTYIEGDITAVSNYSGTHPITVGWRNGVNAGCVFYTSYHIEGASQGSEQEKAIKYLVQNISSVCQ